MENHRRGVTADQIRTWCANPDTQVIVKPVIDLAEHLRVDAYEIPDRLREQTELTDGACVFPWCTRPAPRCDIDHVIAHAKGGTTCSCNTAPLCRRHHRLKTHSPWTYTVLEPGTYLWPSRTATSSSATTKAPSTSPATAVRTAVRNALATHPTSDSGAPDPADTHDRRAHRRGHRHANSRSRRFDGANISGDVLGQPMCGRAVAS